MKKEKTILQIIPTLISGGVERGVIELNEYLTKHNFKSIVLSSGGKLVYKIEQAGGIHIKHNVATKNPFKIWENIEIIKQIIKDYNIDIVHVRSRAPAWSAYYACKALKVPLVSTIHGNYSIGSFPFSFFKKKYNSSMFKADYIICVSNFIKEYSYTNYSSFRDKYMQSKVKIIHRGVDTKIFDPKNITNERVASIISKLKIPSNKQIILLPGRLTEWKGQMYFLDVLKKLKNTDYLCIIVGDCKGHEKYRKALETKIEKLGLDCFVKLENNVTDIATLYLLSTIVVSSSIRGEAFGRVVPEAQAMKRVVVATSIGGSLETLVNNENGFLVNTNDLDTFAKIIDKILLMSVEEKEEIGEKARNYILKNYTIESMCSKTLDLYNEIFESNELS